MPNKGPPWTDFATSNLDSVESTGFSISQTLNKAPICEWSHTSIKSKGEKQKWKCCCCGAQSHPHLCALDCSIPIPDSSCFLSLSLRMERDPWIAERHLHSKTPSGLWIWTPEYHLLYHDLQIRLPKWPWAHSSFLWIPLPLLLPFSLSLSHFFPLLSFSLSEAVIISFLVLS